MIQQEHAGRVTEDILETPNSSELALHTLFDEVFASACDQNKVVALATGRIAACSYVRACEPRAVAALIEMQLDTGHQVRGVLVTPRFWFRAYGELPPTQRLGRACVIRFPWVQEIWLPSIDPSDTSLPRSLFETTIGIARGDYAVDVGQDDNTACRILHTMTADPSVTFQVQAINAVDEACRWPEAIWPHAPPREESTPDSMDTLRHWQLTQDIAA